MKNINLFKYITVITLSLLLVFPLPTGTKQGLASTIEEEQELLFSQEELDQMLAPIALYPDALLAQILTAATYPLEVVSAARFVRENEGLKGAKLLEAAQDKDWDPSVKAMLEFPTVLAMMDEELDWTTDLGDAFLSQQSDVMDSIQRLREKAYAQGNLATNDEQVITVEPQTKIIVIETANPQIVYIPVYDPLIVYGPWWYPAYPPYRYYPARYWTGIYTRVFFVDLFWSGWGIWGCDWHYHYVRINVKRHKDFTRHHYKKHHHYISYKYDRDDYIWRHDSKHRKNVGYRDYSTAKRFGGKIRPGAIKKSSKPDIYKSETILQQPVKNKSKTNKKIQTRTRPLAINNDYRKTKGKAIKQKTTTIKKTTEMKANVDYFKSDTKAKKNNKAPKRDFSVDIKKEIKVRQPKSNVGFETEVQKVRRSSAVKTDKGSAAIKKQKAAVIEKTGNKKQIFSNVVRAAQSRGKNKSAVYDPKISTGFQSGDKSGKNNFRFEQRLNWK